MNGQISLDDDNLVIMNVTTAVDGAKTGHMRVRSYAVNLELDQYSGWDFAILGDSAARWRELAAKAAEIADALDHASNDSGTACSDPSPARNGAGVVEATRAQALAEAASIVRDWASVGRTDLYRMADEIEAGQAPATQQKGEDHPCAACEVGDCADCHTQHGRGCGCEYKGCPSSQSVEDDEDDRVARSLQRESSYWKRVGGYDNRPEGDGDEDDEEVDHA